MELLTFSAVLSFAISMEERAESFYRKAAERDECGSVGDTLSAFARQNGSHRSRLVATRQENVTEMVLEPINDLDSAGYEVDVELMSGMDCARILALAIEVERKAQGFYTDASGKAKHLLAGVARSFIRLGKEKAKRLQELEALVEAAD